MRKEVIKFLSQKKLDNPDLVDRLIVSSFVFKNKIIVENNTLLKGYLIKESSSDENDLFFELKERLNNSNSVFTFEDLIELFEFVVSPKEKILTGAVYTPVAIREFIISKTITQNTDLLLADIACGCGGFLMTAAREIHRLVGKSYSRIISENLWGLDIADYSIKRTKIVLSLLALENGEDSELEFNLFVGDALDFDWRTNCFVIKKNNGFDIIVGNPPYVCSRNIDEKTKKLLAKWEVTKSGHPDLYIPFFQIALENLRDGGTLGYITVNTFFKSVNGRALREYFSNNSFSFRIIDFKDEQVFKKRNTYTCICFIEKKLSPYIGYTSLSSSSIKKTNEIIYTKNKYSSFDNISGWNLVSKASVKHILRKVEGFETKLFSMFSFSTGIATLRNDVYIFNPIRQDRLFFYLIDNGKEYPIEKSICREIINSNKITIENEIENLKKKIIFPYRWNSTEKKYKVIDEDYFKSNYSQTYSYLGSKKTLLAKRDKGKGKYDTWFAYGRSQGLNVKGFKLFLPHITKDPCFVLSGDEKLLFCNGEAIVSDMETKLKVLKKILESDVFWFYIKKTSKPYSSGYLSLGKNYLKQFSIPDFTEKEKKFLLNTDDKKKTLLFLLKKYGLHESDLSS